MGKIDERVDEMPTKETVALLVRVTSLRMSERHEEIGDEPSRTSVIRETDLSSR